MSIPAFIEDNYPLYDNFLSRIDFLFRQRYPDNLETADLSQLDEDFNYQLNQMLLDFLQVIGMNFDYLYKKLKDPNYGIKRLKQHFLSCSFLNNFGRLKVMIGLNSNFYFWYPSPEPIINLMTIPSLSLRSQLNIMLPKAQNIKDKNINGWPVLEYQLPAGQLLFRKTQHPEDISYSKLYWLRPADILANLNDTDNLDQQLKLVIDRVRKTNDIYYPQNSTYCYIYRITKPIKKCLHTRSGTKSDGFLNYLGLSCWYSDKSLQGNYLNLSQEQWLEKLKIKLTSDWTLNNPLEPEVIMTSSGMSDLELVSFIEL